MERLPRLTYPCSHCKRECAVEFSGTFLLVLFGAGTVSLTVLAPVSFSLLIVAAAFGATVAVLILIAGRVSGAHVNPAVTIAQFVQGSLRKELLLPYVTSQFLGSLTAGLVLAVIFSPDDRLQCWNSTCLAGKPYRCRGHERERN